MTISEFKTLWAEYEQKSIPSDTITYLFLNEIDQTIYDSILKIYPEKFMSSTTVSVTSGTSTYSLPADFQSIVPKRSGLFQLDDNGGVSYTYNQTEFGSLKKGFYLDGTNIVITPEPTADVSLTFRYIPDRDLYTTDTDTLILEDKYKKFYLDWFSFLYNVRVENYGSANVRRDFAKEAEGIVSKEYSPNIRLLKTNAFSL